MLQLTLVVFSVAAGCMGWYASFSYAQIALSKVTEELKSVNETIHSNVQQFSLVPFTGHMPTKDMLKGLSMQYALHAICKYALHVHHCDVYNNNIHINIKAASIACIYIRLYIHYRHAYA